jgi:fatty-acyl-CoA synthase
MRGTMMDFPLVLPVVLERAGKLFKDVEILSRRPDQSVVRSNYGEFYRRARKLAAALARLGLQRGERVASLMWNHSTHLEAFFGVPCSGGILHTLNPRLHAHEIAAIARHAADRFVIVDELLLPLLERVRQEVDFEQIIVVRCGPGKFGHKYLNYDELLDAESGAFVYPEIEENEGAAMCFTSGTTGHSKGVVYSHRALVLHSFGLCLPDSCGLSQQDTVLAMSPMFHANAWGLPFAGVMVGARFALPGPNLEPQGLLDWMRDEGVTFAAGVPTICLGLQDALEKEAGSGRWNFRSTVRILCGGAAPPLEMIRRLDHFGLHVVQGWGMTETTPLATISRLKPSMRDWSEIEKYQMRAKQGMAAPFVEARCTREGAEVPWDGHTSGELEVRGPWIAGEYYQAPEMGDRWTVDGWFRTGDVATIDEDGFVKLVDRSKDLVKSGGEWISSVDLENALMGHPAVKEACVVGIPHPKWQERPLAAVVLREGARATDAELREFLSTCFANWQLPDAFVFVEAIPRTSVGKFKKMELRERFANWRWDT